MSQGIDGLAGLAQMGLHNLEKKPQTEEEVQQQFERILAQTLMAQVRKTLEDSSLFQGQAGQFAYLFDQAMADKIVEAGGFGLTTEYTPAPRPTPTIHRGSSEHTHRKRADNAFRVSSAFGLRNDPFTGATRQHSGIDLAAPRGTSIEAVRGGTVQFAGTKGGYGNIVIIDHGDGLTTRYAHCDRLDVTEGDTVSAGTPIGTVGSTGRATGPHLHFEVRQDGNAVDPENFLDRFPLKHPDNDPTTPIPEWQDSK